MLVSSRLRFVGWVALTLLLVGGCGDSPSPQDPAAGPPESPATSPTPAITEYNKGLGFAERKDWDTAIACYSEAIRLKPDWPAPYYNRGNAYDEKGEYDAAIKDYSEAIRLTPDYAMAYNGRGKAYGLKGDKAKAAADFAKAKELEAKK